MNDRQYALYNGKLVMKVYDHDRNAYGPWVYIHPWRFWGTVETLRHLSEEEYSAHNARSK